MDPLPCRSCFGDGWGTLVEFVIYLLLGACAGVLAGCSAWVAG